MSTVSLARMTGASFDSLNPMQRSRPFSSQARQPKPCQTMNTEVLSNYGYRTLACLTALQEEQSKKNPTRKPLHSSKRSAFAALTNSCGSYPARTTGCSIEAVHSDREGKKACVSSSVHSYILVFQNALLVGLQVGSFTIGSLCINI